LGLVARTLGAQNDGKGPVISNANLDGDTLGDEHEDSSGRATIRLDLKDLALAESKGTASGAGALAHEVTHGIDGARFGDHRSLADVFQREVRGYAVQVMVDQNLELSTPFSTMTSYGDIARLMGPAHASCASCANSAQAQGQFVGQSCLK
jgi:hypothetical protein